MSPRGRRRHEPFCTGSEVPRAIFSQTQNTFIKTMFLEMPRADFVDATSRFGDATSRFCRCLGARPAGNAWRSGLRCGNAWRSVLAFLRSVLAFWRSGVLVLSFGVPALRSGVLGVRWRSTSSVACNSVAMQAIGTKGPCPGRFTQNRRWLPSIIRVSQ